MKPLAPRLSGGLAQGGLDPTIQQLYSRWVHVAIVVVAAMYAVVTVIDYHLVTLEHRMLTVVAQGATVLVLTAAYVVCAKGRVGTAAVMGMAAIWLELHVSLIGPGIEIAGLVAFPVLVLAAGMLFGGGAAYAMAALSTVTIQSVVVVGHVAQGLALPDTVLWIHTGVVTSGSMFATAAMLDVALRGLWRLIDSARASEERLSTLVAHAPYAILTATPERTVASANPAAERLIGVQADTLLSQPLGDVLRAAAAGEREWPRLEDLLESPGPEAVPLGFVTADGTARAVEAVSAPLPWPGGRQGLLLVLRDVTERRRSEEAQRLLQTQLEHALRLEAVGRLAGGIAHDFNNLLTVIGGSAELLAAEVDEPNRELALDILEAKVRGAALTGQLLSFARKDVVQVSLVSLQEVVAGMEPLLARFLTEGLALELDVDPDAPPVVADRAQIEQIVVNLVINAKDAMDQAGQVTLGAHGPGTARRWHDERWVVPAGFVELSVADDGRGMDRGTAGRIFEPFFTTKPPGKGTGLGLSTVHGIVKQNGGDVVVHSAPGHGTVLVISWPEAAEGSNE